MRQVLHAFLVHVGGQTSSSLLQLGQKDNGRKKMRKSEGRKRGRENGRYVRAESEEGVTLIPEWEGKKLHTHTHTHLVLPVSALYLS